MPEQNVAPNGRAIIIGAGVTGLTVGWQLASAGMDVLLLEATDHLGGMAVTFKHGDFLLDMGPHKFFSVMEDRMQTARELMGEEFLTVPKRSRIRLSGHFLNYPIGLLDVIKNLDPFIAVTGGGSYLLQLIRNIFDQRRDVSYEDWLVRRFGPRLYQLIFAEYARKIWGEPRTLARELAETRVAVPGLLPLLWHMLFARNKGPTIHAETFNYPRFGSGQFCDRLAELVVEYGGTIRFDAGVTRLFLVNDNQRVASIQLEAAESISVHTEDVLVTTIPVSYLSNIIEPAPPAAVTEAAMRLKTRPLILLYLIINQPSISNDNWLFFPEEKYIFNRVFEQKNFSPFMCPQDKTVLCLEIVASDKDLWRASETDLYERAISELEETGMVTRSQVIEYFSRRLKWAYPVYDLDYRRNTETVLQYLDSIPDLYSVGRQGGFNYVGQIDCLDIGIITAEHILKCRQTQDAAEYWAEARRRFANYIVLD
jgi:protoporphyrinogen oxidase